MENDCKIERNYGIDLLRLLSMFFVVLLHSLGKGGIIYNTDINSIQYKVGWIMEIVAFCAVDIFALISGYVSYDKNKEKKINYANYGILWLEIVFYGILITFLFDILNITDVTLRDYTMALLPVSNNLYWYFTAYTGLFVIMPFINKAIVNTSEKDLKRLIMLLLLIFSFFESIVRVFNFNNGYSFIWLLILYIIGAIIKKCEIGKYLKTRKIIFGIVCLVIITYLYKIYGFELTIFEITINKDWFVSYTSPTVLVMAILYIILFSRINFKDKYIKIIKFLAPSAFAIYILNNHRFIWYYVMDNIFINIINDSVIKIILYPLIFSFSFSIIAIYIDKVRDFIFKKMKIKYYLEKILYNYDKIHTSDENG